MHAFAAAISAETGLAPRLVDARGAARLLAVSRSRVYELTSAGDLPQVHLGRSARWLVSDIDAFIQRKRADLGPGRIAD